MKTPHKMNEWHPKSDEQERRRIANKKRKKNLKNLNRKARKAIGQQ